MRVVTVLEKEGKGLNLTMETLDGIRNHSFGHAQTLEGRLVKIADKVAYINHDIEDAIRAGVLTKEDLPQDCIEVLGDTKSKRITTIATSILEYTKEDIAMAPEVLQAHNKLRKFMFEHVYLSVPAKQAEEAKAVQVVEQMYHYYLTHEKELPEFYRQIAQKEDLHRAVCDYISGMSDQAKDPDEYIKTYGADRFKVLLEQSENVIKNKLKRLKSRYNLDEPEEQVKYIHEYCLMISELYDKLERDVYAGSLAVECNLSKAAVLEQVEHLRKQQYRRKKSKEWKEIQSGKAIFWNVFSRSSLSLAGTKNYLL